VATGLDHGDFDHFAGRHGLSSGARPEDQRRRLGLSLEVTDGASGSRSDLQNRYAAEKTMTRSSSALVPSSSSASQALPRLRFPPTSKVSGLTGR
jgi:hypothetical protein